MPGKLEIVQEVYDRVRVAGAVEEAGRCVDTNAEASGLMPDLAVHPNEFPEFLAALQQMLNMRRITIAKPGGAG